MFLIWFHQVLKNMDIFDNSDLEYLVDDFHGFSDSEDDEPFGEFDHKSEADSDFEDDPEPVW